MGCLRSTITALLLYISMVSMVDFLILAHRGISLQLCTLFSSTDQLHSDSYVSDLNKNNNEVQFNRHSFIFLVLQYWFLQTWYQGQASAQRWHRVRRMAAEEVKEEVRSCMKLTTGANPSSVRKCEHGEEEPRVGCELSLRIRSSSSRFKFVELIPFSTDYHLPKNNRSHLRMSRGLNFEPIYQSKW